MTFNLLIVLICAMLTIPLHEFGHYIMAKLFGWNPRFVLTRDIVAVRYNIDTVVGNETKMLLTSYFGILGVIPFMILFVWSQDIGLFPICLFLAGYSTFEVLMRWRSIKKQKRIRK